MVEQYELASYEHDTTSNRMELISVFESLHSLQSPMPAQVISDSQYVIKGILLYSRGWTARGGVLWKRSGEVVSNSDLWLPLLEQVRQRPMRADWVRGHTGYEENERVDELARSMARFAQELRAD